MTDSTKNAEKIVAECKRWAGDNGRNSEDRNRREHGYLTGVRIACLHNPEARAAINCAVLSRRCDELTAEYESLLMAGVKRS